MIVSISGGYDYKKKRTRYYVPPVVLPKELNLSLVQFLASAANLQETRKPEAHVFLHHNQQNPISPINSERKGKTRKENVATHSKN